MWYLIYACEHMYEGENGKFSVRIDWYNSIKQAKAEAKGMSLEIMTDFGGIYDELSEQAFEITKAQEEEHAEAHFGKFYAEEWEDHYESNLDNLMAENVAYEIYELPCVKDDDDIKELERRAENDLDAFLEEYHANEALYE